MVVVTRSEWAGLAAACVGLVGAVALPSPAQETPTGRWSAAGALAVGRYAPGGVLLRDGRVVVAGGYSFEMNRTHATSEVFDPKSERWSSGPSMRLDRNFPLVFQHPDGDWIFATGFQIRGGTSAWVLRLDTGRTRFVVGPRAVEERELAAVAPLGASRFLITGGYSTVRRRTLDTAEIYDAREDRFLPVAARLQHARFGHAAVGLPDGRVLVVGGKLLETNGDVVPAELYDPVRETFVESGRLAVGRDRVTAWLWRGPETEGTRVVIAGGSAQVGGTVPARRCEIYSVREGLFRVGPELVRDRMAHTATEMEEGRVLLVGGWSGSENRTTGLAELWNPATGRFQAAGQQQQGRHDHVAVRLRDGRVLVAGGKEAPARDGIESPRPAELWSP